MKYKNIFADEVEIGVNVLIEPTAVIRGISGNAKRIVIGDNTYIGKDVQIICNHFEIGDYGKIHHHTNIHGYKPCILGHNIWVGQFCIIDSIGGVTIGNNCGIGAHSQLWSHIKYGDVLEGCKFLSEKSLKVGNDVWFVGHTIVSPITAEDKAMALVGSVVVKDMKFNTIYSGTPAKPLSEDPNKSSQFIEKTLTQKKDELLKHLEDSKVNKNKIKIVIDVSEINLDDDITYFIISTRSYTKKRSKEEFDFMKYLLPEKAKFVPH